MRFETISEIEDFRVLASAWDDLVRAAPRPSPFMLHGWLLEWWQHYGSSGTLTVHVAYRGDKLAGALPLYERSFFGVRAVQFMGGWRSVLGDLLMAHSEDDVVAAGLADRLLAQDVDYVDLYGVTQDCVLSRAVAPSRLTLVERSEAPVMDIAGSWEAVYLAKTNSKQRRNTRARRRQLAAAGLVRTSISRDPAPLSSALEEAFSLHSLRWRGRPDRSGFTTPAGAAFERAALNAFADAGVARIATLRLNERPIAYYYYIVLCDRLYAHSLAFDPSFARFSPGTHTMLEAMQAASDEGVRTVEFLGGDDPYKLTYADRCEPLYQALGLARTLKGHAIVVARAQAIHARRSLKHSPSVRKLYYRRLAPLRQAKFRARRGWTNDA